MWPMLALTAVSNTKQRLPPLTAPPPGLQGLDTNTILKVWTAQGQDGERPPLIATDNNELS